MSALGHKRTSTGLLDHLVSAEQDGLGHFETECLSGLPIEDELKLRYPLDRKIGGIGAFEYPVHEDGRAAKECNNVRPLTYYATGSRDIFRTNREKPSPRRQCHNRSNVANR